MGSKPDFVLIEEESAAPAVIGRYQILSTLGSGGMGVVYRAFDPELNRAVAIKTLKPLPGEISAHVDAAFERFKIEARSAGSLRHPNIITVFEAQHQGSLPFIVMEYIEGESLESLLARQKRLSHRVALYYLDQVAAGLDYAHRKGVIHRDIKPSNILIDAANNTFILDFGVAALACDLEGEQQTNDPRMPGGRLQGSPGYVAPEQLLNQIVDHRADIFSLGVIAFESLTGCRPFQGATVTSIIENTLIGRRPAIADLLPEFPAELERVFAKALSPRPDERYALARELVTDLRTALIPHDENRASEMEGGRILFRPAAKADHAAAAEAAAKKAEAAAASGAKVWGETSSNPGATGSTPWSAQQRHSDREYQQKAQSNPGRIFDHATEAVGERSAAIRAQLPVAKLFVLGLIVITVIAIPLGIYFGFLSPSAPPPPAPAQTEAPAPENDIAQISKGQIDRAAADLPIGQMTNKQLLGTLLQDSGSEERTLAGLREAALRNIPRLVDACAFTSSHASPKVRAESMRIVRTVGDRRIAPYVMPLLEDTNATVRLEAARAIAVLGNQSSVSYLNFRLSQERDPAINAELKRAIESITGLAAR